MEQKENSVLFRIGHEELAVRNRYEVLSIGNDVLIAVWFVVGSVLFFFESTTVIGTWFFLVGSIQFLIRPLIRLLRRIHLRRYGSGAPNDTARDF